MMEDGCKSLKQFNNIPLREKNTKLREAYKIGKLCIAQIFHILNVADGGHKANPIKLW